MRTPRILSFALLLACLLFPARKGSAGYFDGKAYPILTDSIFTADEFILDQAKFWYEIYTVVGDDEGLIHDPFYPDLVFKRVRVPGAGRAASKAAEAQVKAVQAEIKGMLARDSAGRSPRDWELHALFPNFWDSTAIRLSAERLRFQRGLKGKFREGLQRSYRYLPMIDSVFASEGVPTRLRFLPHVESSFYPYAYSKVGAAGMWQFMKSSARRYGVKVAYLVDERRDPHVATRAAARLLAYNYGLLKTWPLAIVAYNHGPGGLAAAVRGQRTSDLGTIIKSYYSNSFGFASKNFYAEFLAASSIALQADALFGKFPKLEPLPEQTLVLTKACPTRTLCALSGLSPDELEEYNLGLRPATFRGNAQLPKGYALKLPQSLDVGALAAKLGMGGTVASVKSKKTAESASVAMAAPALAAPQDKVENRTEEQKPGGPVDSARYASHGAPSPSNRNVTSSGKTGSTPGSAAKAEPVLAPAGSQAGSPSPNPDVIRVAAAAEKAIAPKISEAKDLPPGRDGVKAPVLETTLHSDTGSAPKASSPAAPSSPAVVASAGPAQVPAVAGPTVPKPPGTSNAQVIASAVSPGAVSASTPTAMKTPAPAPATVAKVAPSSPPVKAWVPSPAGSAAVASSPAPTTPSAPAPVPASSAPQTASAPPAAGSPSGPRPGEPEGPQVVDSTLALQSSDVDRLAHPLDRFNPSIYNLGYTYAGGMLTIQVGTEETLSHYAEWGGVSESALRRLNRIRSTKDIRMGRSVRIPLGEEKSKEFLKRREEYYRAIEEDFYSNYYVSVTEPLRVEKGMNLWGWAQEREIPFWLLQKHNAGISLNELHPGDTLNLPVIETGIRKWGFTRYSNSREYLSGIARFLRSGKAEAF